MAALRLPSEIEPLVRFTIKVVVGAIGFLVIFAVAVGLALLVGAAEAHAALPEWLVRSAGWVEILIWSGDLIVYGLFLVREIVETVRALLEEWRTTHDG